MNSNQVSTNVQSVVDFQAGIHTRIQNHAKRVESFQLAASPLVQNDIERTMAQVWKSLPSGFGAREGSIRPT